MACVLNQKSYYNKQWGRFLNADKYVQTGQGMLDKNMYAYCSNNPINRFDPTGEGWFGDLCSNIWSGTKQVAQTAWNGVKSGAQAVWNGTKAVVGSVVSIQVTSTTVVKEINTPSLGGVGSTKSGTAINSGKSSNAVITLSLNSNRTTGDVGAGIIINSRKIVLEVNIGSAEGYVSGGIVSGKDISSVMIGVTPDSVFLGSNLNSYQGTAQTQDAYVKHGVNPLVVLAGVATLIYVPWSLLITGTAGVAGASGY